MTSLLAAMSGVLDDFANHGDRNERVRPNVLELHELSRLHAEFIPTAEGLALERTAPGHLSIRS